MAPHRRWRAHEPSPASRSRARARADAQLIVFEDPAGLRRCMELIERDGGGDDAADGVGGGMCGRGVRAVAVRVKNRYDGEYDASESTGYRCDVRAMTMHDVDAKAHDDDA